LTSDQIGCQSFFVAVEPALRLGCAGSGAGSSTVPFLEVNDFSDECLADKRKAASRSMTDVLAEAYGIEPKIISIYFGRYEALDYAHAGVHPADASTRRIFVKVHAFERPLEKRRGAADLLSRAASAAYGVPLESVAVYFLDSGRAWVAHGGVLECDREAVI
jgi:hypothetical protein